MGTFSTLFSGHNSHLDGGLAHFKKFDPHLKRLNQMNVRYENPLIYSLPKISNYGVYTLGGARQIGKTTLLKQWMVKLLESKVTPNKIFFLTGELISDHLKLTSMMREILHDEEKEYYIIIDEVTYINDWDKAVKFLADAGLLEKTVLILTGSDLLLIQEARARFPGRRGKSDVVDFHLYPLSFKQVVDLKMTIENAEFSESNLSRYFNEFMIHGGFLTAINDFSVNKDISKSTLATYSDWILGDMFKRGKQETYLREILTSLIKKYSSSLSWNNLASDLSIDHPATVADYVHLLARLDVVLIHEALIEDKLVAAPKKGKKIFFKDPFIFHAIKFWLKDDDQTPIEQIQKTLNDSDFTGHLIKGIVAADFHRRMPTYYIKNESEIDLAYVKNKKIFPIEICWGNNLNQKKIKQLKKYPKLRLWGKKFISTGDIVQEFLPLALYQVEL